MSNKLEIIKLEDALSTKTKPSAHKRYIVYGYSHWQNAIRMFLNDNVDDYAKQKTHRNECTTEMEFIRKLYCCDLK